MAASPELLILDEAVGALDVLIRAQAFNLLADIREATGIAYLSISHDLAVVRQLCVDVVVMRHGRRGYATDRVLSLSAGRVRQTMVDSIPG